MFKKWFKDDKGWICSRCNKSINPLVMACPYCSDKPKCKKHVFEVLNDNGVDSYMHCLECNAPREY